MAVWLVTGASGFVGRHVLKALLDGATPATGDGQVVVLGRRCPPGWPDGAFAQVDLNDAAATRLAVARIAPDVVIHTAGRTPPAADEELYRMNFWATNHLMSALGSLRKKVRVVLSGSAAELGPVDEAHLPVNESHPCDPWTAYGRSKYLATKSALSERPPLEVMVARVFNPIGPEAPPTQALGQFALGLAEPNHDPLELTVGDLDSRRDFIDVRDVARAMVALANCGRPGLVYHVGTGKSHRVGDALYRLIKLSNRTIRLRFDPALVDRRGPADSRQYRPDHRAYELASADLMGRQSARSLERRP